MIEYVGRIKEVAARGKTLYKTHVVEELKGVIIELKNTIKECIDSHAREPEFKLIVSNDSSSDIKLYEIVDRVKTADSLEEKIIRNQEFFDLVSLENDSEFIEKLIKCNDDLLGLRILVSLSCDCERMHGLFKKYEDELRTKEIEFLDLAQNPQTMRNGRHIYRIKGNYKHKYMFELQIKSKVDSAWADIEHMLFYKDYQFSYIQSTNKEVMNKLGTLLDKVDDLMIQIRESQESYENEKDEMRFTHYLGEKFRNHLIDNIGSAYLLSSYRRPFYLMFKEFSSASQEQLYIKNSPSIGEFLHFKRNEDSQFFFANYDRLKEVSLELVLAEHIYSSWKNDLSAYDSFLDENEHCMFFESFVRSIITCNFEYFRDRTEIDNDFYIWAAKVITDTMKMREISFTSKPFIFSREKMFMFYSYFRACERQKQDMGSSDVLQDAESEEISAWMSKIDLDVVADMFDTGKKEYHVKAICDALEEREDIEYINADFITFIDEEYSVIEKSQSGRNMPANRIREIVEEVLNLKGTR